MYDQAHLETIISRRRSCRNYLDQAISPHEQLMQVIAENGVSPFGNGARFKLITADPKERTTLKGLGTYGFIRGAKGFVAGAVRKAPFDLEHYGYQIEKIIIQAASLGLSTYWLGGSFSKSAFARTLDVRPDESMPAVAAIGHGASTLRRFDAYLRRSAGSDHRKPFGDLFFDEAFDQPLTKEMAGDHAFALQMVRLAPSASNRQPWRVIRDRNHKAWHFLMRRTKGYRERNRRFFNIADLQRVDMGIAVYHFDLALHSMAMSGQWHVQPPTDLALPELTEYSISWIDIP